MIVKWQQSEFDTEGWYMATEMPGSVTYQMAGFGNTAGEAVESLRAKQAHQYEMRANPCLEIHL